MLLGNYANNSYIIVIDIMFLMIADFVVVKRRLIVKTMPGLNWIFCEERKNEWTYSITISIVFLIRLPNAPTGPLTEAADAERPRLSGRVARLLRSQPGVRLTRHARSTVQPDQLRTRRLPPHVLRSRLSHNRPRTIRRLQLQILLVLSSCVRQMHARGRAAFLQLSIRVGAWYIELYISTCVQPIGRIVLGHGVGGAQNGARIITVAIAESS